jgi:hypothetical protein
MKIISYGVLLWLLSVGSVQAATLYLDPHTAELNRGDAIVVAIRLDTDEAALECINAVDGVISYSDTIVPVDISLGESIFPVWVESPTINDATKTITFAGGIPNGYCGRVEGDPNLTNTIAEIIFRSRVPYISGETERVAASVLFTDQTTAYENDGLGTKAELTTYGATFSISPEVGTEIVDTWSEEVQADTLPPEAFSIALERDKTTFGGKAYIVFNTTDKQTGISHYEVIEESTSESKLFRFGAANNPWEKTRSPFVLKDQSLNSLIRVRAIDKAGNEYIATLQPDPSMQTIPLKHTLVIAFSIFVALGALVLLVFTRILRTKKKRTQALSSDSLPGRDIHD